MGAVNKWQIKRDEPQPDWTHIAGNLDVDEQCFPDGSWLVLREGAPHCQFLTQDQYEAEFGEVQ